MAATDRPLVQSSATSIRDVRRWANCRAPSDIAGWLPHARRQDAAPTGHLNDVRLYRDLINSGIQDYLLKPLDPEALREALG